MRERCFSLPPNINYSFWSDFNLFLTNNYLLQVINKSLMLQLKEIILYE